MELFLWILGAAGFGLFAYAYLGYPLVVRAAAVMRGVRRGLNATHQPPVSLIVCAYNEEVVIGPKVRNLLELDYPTGRLELIVASDGSTDRTVEIVRQYPQIRLLHSAQRRGKAGMINLALQEARNEILVFSDANVLWAKDALRVLVQHFNDPAVGAVCGRLLFRIQASGTCAFEENVYWEYDGRLKAAEGTLGVCVGGNGGIYAVRRRLVQDLDTGARVADDLALPLMAAMAGYQVVYEPMALAFESHSESVRMQMRRRMFIAFGGLNLLRMMPALRNPFGSLIAFCFWSHKVARWISPLGLCAVLLASLLLAGESRLASWTLAGQLALYAVAMAGLVADLARVNIGPIRIPYYYVAMQAGLLLGLLRFLLAREGGYWEKVRS